MNQIIKNYLKEYSINYKLHKHPAAFSVEESKKIIGNKIPGLRTKSLFLKDENNLYYIITMPGEKKLNTKALKQHLKIKELHFASPEEMQNEIKVQPGSVSILCMLNASAQTQLILDKEVYNAALVDFHPDINTESLEVSHENFVKLYNSLNCKKQILALPYL